MDAFLERIDFTDDCWLWTGALDDAGYGRWTQDGGSNLAHRWIYETFVEPAGEALDHLCRVRRCVNPDHLESVTQAENIARGARRAQTHCKHDHEFTAENTYVNPRGQRQCRACARIQRAAYEARRAA